jgi:hypothetical protein
MDMQAKGKSACPNPFISAQAKAKITVTAQ